MILKTTSILHELVGPDRSTLSQLATWFHKTPAKVQPMMPLLAQAVSPALIMFRGTS
jgi:hypothetical protein